jgi:hypothetical protein
MGRCAGAGEEMKKIKAWGLEKDGELMTWDWAVYTTQVPLWQSKSVAGMHAVSGERVVRVEVTVEKIPARMKG